MRLDTARQVRAPRFATEVQIVLINRNSDLPFADMALEPGEYTLGRSSQCDVPVSDTTISRRHARLVVDENSISVTDLGSLNGTFIQEHRTTSGSVLLGQEVRFGRVVFLVDRLSHYVPRPEFDEDQTAILRRGQNVPEDHPVRSVLTPGRLRVLACLVEGLTEKEVAARLNLSRHTVHNHIRDIYAHLGVRSRGELLAMFIPSNQDALPLAAPEGLLGCLMLKTSPEINIGRLNGE
jgi:DNA-binding CsgD family transcriptional regulator